MSAAGDRAREALERNRLRTELLDQLDHVRSTGGAAAEAARQRPAIGSDEDLAEFRSAIAEIRLRRATDRKPFRPPPVGPCPCECNSGGFCGGCGHAGCGGRR